MNRSIVFMLGWAVTACAVTPDDPFDPDGADESTSDSTGDSASGGTEGDDQPDDSSDPDDGGNTTEDGGETDDGGTDTGTDEPPADHRWLFNDGWTEGAGLAWQVWAGPDDCWASILQVEAQYVPFVPVRVRVAIGDSRTTETFSLSLREVDNQGRPSQLLGETSVEIQGKSDWTDVDLTGLGLGDTLNLDEFAVVMCHASHRGAPSIATDADGTVAGRSNWVYQAATGEWVQAAEFGTIDGDFMLRVLIDTEP